MAYIYDMVVLPPEGMVEGIGISGLVSHELQRVNEYMRLADNKAEYETSIRMVRELYGVEEEENDDVEE